MSAHPLRACGTGFVWEVARADRGNFRVRLHLPSKDRKNAGRKERKETKRTEQNKTERKEKERNGMEWRGSPNSVATLLVLTAV